jgi:L-aminopeptidase/D-esterase-like protein
VIIGSGSHALDAAAGSGWQLTLTAKSSPLPQLHSTAMTPGRRNLLTDVPGIRVGHADDQRLASGATAILFDEPVAAAIDVRGGGPGTRETDLLDPARTVERIDAITLSGGSALGLDAAGGVQAYLRGIGRGFAIGSARVPLVPAAIMFDLLNGGDKSWDRYPPYRELGYAAAESAAAEFALGSVGAGLGATTVNFKGGVGSASHVLDSGITVAALAVVNAVGSVVVGDGPWFWAAPFERNAEFGGHGFPTTVPAEALEPRTKGAARVSTTLVVVATDAAFTKAQTRHLAVMAQDGLALAIHPVHTPLDGDVVFAAATGRHPLDAEPAFALAGVGNAAAQTVARAIARAVYKAAPLALEGAQPGYRNRYR